MTGLSFSPDGHYLASGGWDGSLFLWDLTQTPPKRFDLRPMAANNDPGVMNSAAVFALQFTPDGNTLIESGNDGGNEGQKIMLWDLAGKKVRSEIRYQPDNAFDDFRAFALSPDGNILAEATSKRIRLFNLAMGEALPSPVRQLADNVNALAFSPDGRLLASGGDDKTVTVWDVASLQVITQLGQYGFPVSSLSFSPDGRYLVNTGDITLLHVWDIGLEEWQAAACPIANRNLTPSEWQNYLPGIPYHKTCPEVP